MDQPPKTNVLEAMQSIDQVKAQTPEELIDLLKHLKRMKPNDARISLIEGELTDKGVAFEK